MSARSSFSCRAFAAALAFAALAIPVMHTPARADETSGPYVMLSGGEQFRSPAAENPLTYTDFQPGYAAGGALGYQFKQFGVDLEYTHVLNFSQTVAAVVTGPAPGLGYITLDFGLVNLRYEAPIGGSMIPYVSVGAGAYSSHLHGDTNTIANSFGFAAYGTNTAPTLAYQVRAGFEFPVVQHFKLLLGYRFLRGGNLVFKNTAFGTLYPNGATLNEFEISAKLGH